VEASPRSRCLLPTWNGWRTGVSRLVHDPVTAAGGSISAEHGIGRVKQKAFLERIDPVTLDLAAGIKEAFDPRHILSNGRILAPTSAVDYR